MRRGKNYFEVAPHAGFAQSGKCVQLTSSSNRRFVFKAKLRQLSVVPTFDLDVRSVQQQELFQRFRPLDLGETHAPSVILRCFSFGKCKFACALQNTRKVPRRFVVCTPQHAQVQQLWDSNRGDDLSKSSVSFGFW